MAKEEIQLVLVSGFMGAGKTTFLQYILNQQHHKKIGILVNEFGPVGIDGKILKGADAEIVEINNGSIFCACLKNNFVCGICTGNFPMHPKNYPIDPHRPAVRQGTERAEPCNHAGSGI